jgi:hypothetical protein
MSTFFYKFQYVQRLIMSRDRAVSIFFLYTLPGPLLRPTQPPIQWVPGASFPRVKQLGHEADHSLPASAEVKNTWIYISKPPPPYICMVWCLIC